MYTTFILFLIACAVFIWVFIASLGAIGNYLVQAIAYASSKPELARVTAPSLNLRYHLTLLVISFIYIMGYIFVPQ